MAPLQSLSPAATIARFAAIGAVMLAVVGIVAYTGGWLSPRRLTQTKFIAAFEAVNGVHPGFRRNHAKGVCVSGWFESNGAAEAVSSADMFKPGRVPLIGRFALASAMPMQTDTAPAVRSFALRVTSLSGQEWRTGMNDIPVFAVNSPKGFYEQLVASKPAEATGKPDPVAMQRFLSQHPETVHAIALITARAVSSGFANDTYNSLNAFELINAAGRAVPVRWAVVPLQPFAAPDAEQSVDQDKNYLFNALLAEIHEHPLQWRLIFTLGQPGDPTDDATLPWAAARRQIDAGTVTIDAASGEDGGACTGITFDPLVLPPGMKASHDPLLSARSSVYAASLTLRDAEKAEKPPSAVTTQAASAGANP